MRGQRRLNNIRTYAPIITLWIIGAFVLFRGFEHALDQNWASTIRSYVIGLALILVANTIGGYCRNYAQMLERLDRLEKIVEDEGWQVDSCDAATKLAAAIEDTRDASIPVQMFRRDGRSSR